MQRLLAVAISFFVAGVASADTSVQDVPDRFVGKWTGTATAYYPREPDRPERIESVSADCVHELKATYVRCDTTWKDESGNTRELLMYWNYDARDEKVRVLYMYDNWPGIVNYPLEWEAASRKLTGEDSFTAAEGVPAEERVLWHFSADGSTIESVEENHYQTDPENYWARSFEFTWNRVEE